MNEHNERKHDKPASRLVLTNSKSVTIITAVLVLLFLFMGYGFVKEKERWSAEMKVLQPKYKYEFVLDDKVRGEPASTFVDIKIAGSDMPLKIKAPANLDLSWTISENMKDKNCVVYGRDADGAFFEMQVQEDSSLVISNVDFNDVREEGDVDTYSISCLANDGMGGMIEELDEVEVELVK